MTGVTTTLRRLLIGAALLGVACGETPAFAQQTPAAAGAPAADAPAAPVPELQPPEPPAATLDAARQVVIASGMSRSFAPMVPDLMNQIIPLITQTKPELKPDLTQVLKDLEPEFTKDGEHMTDIAAHVYARRMSEEDLKAAAAFFNTAAGKKYVEVQPGMLDELVVAMQSWTQELSGIMMRRVRQEMVKKGHPNF